MTLPPDTAGLNPIIYACVAPLDNGGDDDDDDDNRPQARNGAANAQPGSVRGCFHQEG